MAAGPEPLRFADILTNAAAVANYLNEPDITARHVVDAVAILLGTKTMDELAPPVSPFIRRPRSGGGVTAGVRGLVQRWFVALGDANATLDGEQLDAFLADLAALAAEEDAG